MAVETERLEGEIGVKTTLLGEKEDTLRLAKEAKTTFDNRKKELQDEVTRLNDDASATEEQKTQAQSDLDDHNATETTITDALSTAQTERDNLDDEIKQDANTREENAYQAEKQKRDAKFLDLEGQKLDEEAQLATLQEQLQNWKRKRAEATLEDNDDKFDEMHAQVLKAEKALETAQTKLDKTTRDFETEKVAKDKRDLDEAVAEGERLFNERSAERQTQYETLNGLLTTAKDDLQANLDEIERLNSMLANDPDNTTLQDELTTAEGETQGLRDARDTARTNLDPVLKSQG